MVIFPPAMKKTLSPNATWFYGILATLIKVGCKQLQIYPLDIFKPEMA